jgi:hypothetical protein
VTTDSFSDNPLANKMCRVAARFTRNSIDLPQPGIFNLGYDLMFRIFAGGVSAS